MNIYDIFGSDMPRGKKAREIEVVSENSNMPVAMDSTSPVGGKRLDELSPETLASYKKKAGAAATAADKAGDYAKGHKRFKGIVKATNKEFDKSAKKGVAEGTESAIQKIENKIQAKRDALSLAREQRRMRGRHQQGPREIKIQADLDRLSNELTQLKSQSVAETSDYFRRREREEGIISGKKPARKKAPAQTSDYAKRREQEKKQGVAEAGKSVAQLRAEIKKELKDREDPERYSNRPFLDKLALNRKSNDHKKFVAPVLKIKEQGVDESSKSDFRKKVEQQQLDTIEKIKNSDYSDLIKKYLIAINDPTGPVFRSAYYSFPKGQEAKERFRDFFAQKYNIDPSELEHAEQMEQIRAFGLKGVKIKEDAEGLSVGDDVIITGDVRFKGATGVIDSFGQDNRFVVVNLYNHGKHSFQSSDVSYNDYADSDDEEARAYDRGEFTIDDEMDEDQWHGEDDQWSDGKGQWSDGRGQWSESVDCEITDYLAEMKRAGYDIK